MGKAYSEFFDVTVDGNMLIRHNNDIATLVAISESRGQFTVLRSGGTDTDPLFDISYPMDDNDHRIFAALIHRANSTNKLGSKLKPREDGPDGDGTPPSGGTPGAANQVEFENTWAIAA